MRGEANMDRTFSGTIIVLAIGIVISGCSERKTRFPDPPTPASPNAYVSVPDSFVRESRHYAAEHGTIAVPENRNNPSSRLIYLPVIRIHALSGAPSEPIFGLTGGPGLSNMNWAPPETLLADHDFVMVGFRGIDGSTALDCPDLSEALTHHNELLSDEALRNFGVAWQTSMRKLIAQGIDLNGYTIPETIEDLDAVRRALRYPRINLLSESYGTRVAYLYGLMHPESIYRSVMIGVNPPGHFVWDPRTVDDQIRYYARLWSRDSSVAGRSRDLAATMRTVLHTMPSHWLFIPIHRDKVRIATFTLLFHRRTAALAFDAYVAAERGDYSGLALISAAFDYTFPSGPGLGDLALKAISADFDSTQTYSGGTERPDAILGSPLGQFVWKPTLYGRLPVDMIPERLRKPERSDVETLLLSGSIDVSTPAEYATNEMLPLLRNGRQIIIAECGHVGDIWNLRRGTVEKIIASYYITGVPFTSSVEYIPMDFSVGWGFPTIAKIGVAAICLLAVALVMLIIWLIRKIARRKARRLVDRPATV